MVDRRATSLLLLVLAASLMACGDEATTTAATVTQTVTETSAATVTETVTEAPTVDTDPPPDVSTTQLPDEASPSEPTSIGTDSAGQALGLDQAYAAYGSWDEARYEIAGRVDIRGIGVDVTECGVSDRVPTLEYRLANRFDTLSFSFGQDDRSPASDQDLIVSIIGNESQIDVQRVPFNQVKSVDDVPVTGVNALKIQFYLDEEDGDCDEFPGVTGVLENLTVQ